MDRVGTDEPFQFAAFADSQAGAIQMPHFRELVGDGFVRCHAVEMAAFHHERPRGDQCRHLGIIERAAQIEFEDLVFRRPDITVRRRDEAFFQTHSLKSAEQIDRQ